MPEIASSMVCSRAGKLGPQDQDKRSVIPIELADVDQWLYGTPEEAATLVTLPPLEAFNGAPVNEPKKGAIA